MTNAPSFIELPVAYSARETEPQSPWYVVPSRIIAIRAVYNASDIWDHTLVYVDGFASALRVNLAVDQIEELLQLEA